MFQHPKMPECLMHNFQQKSLDIQGTLLSTPSAAEDFAPSDGCSVAVGWMLRFEYLLAILRPRYLYHCHLHIFSMLSYSSVYSWSCVSVPFWFLKNNTHALWKNLLIPQWRYTLWIPAASPLSQEDTGLRRGGRAFLLLGSGFLCIHGSWYNNAIDTKRIQNMGELVVGHFSSCWWEVKMVVE